MKTDPEPTPEEQEIAREVAEAEIQSWLAGNRHVIGCHVLAAIAKAKSKQEPKAVVGNHDCEYDSEKEDSMCKHCGLTSGEAVRYFERRFREQEPKALEGKEPPSDHVGSVLQKKTQSASAAIYEFEQSLVGALKLVRLAHSSVSRTFEGDGGDAHPSLGLMEISQRALRQADDAARYARHALSAVVPRS